MLKKSKVKDKDDADTSKQKLAGQHQNTPTAFSFDFSIVVHSLQYNTHKRWTPENFVIEWKRNDQIISTQPVKPSHHTKDVVLSMNDQEMKMQAYLTRDNAEGKIFAAKNYKLSLLDVYKEDKPPKVLASKIINMAQFALVTGSTFNEVIELDPASSKISGVKLAVTISSIFVSQEKREVDQISSTSLHEGSIEEESQKKEKKNHSDEKPKVKKTRSAQTTEPEVLPTEIKDKNAEIQKEVEKLENNILHVQDLQEKNLENLLQIQETHQSEIISVKKKSKKEKKALENEIVSLKEEIESLKKAQKEKSGEVHQLETEVKNKSEIELGKEKQIQFEKDKGLAEVEILKNEIEEKNIQIEMCQNDHRALQIRTESLENTNKGLLLQLQTVTSLKEQNTDLEKENMQLKAKIEELKHEISHVAPKGNEDLEGNDDEFVALQLSKFKEEMNQKNQEYETKINALLKENTDKEKEFDELLYENIQLKGAYQLHSDYQKESQRLLDENQKLINEKTALETEIQQLKEERQINAKTSLEGKILGTEQGFLVEENEELKMRIKGLENQNKNLIEELDILQEIGRSSMALKLEVDKVKKENEELIQKEKDLDEEYKKLLDQYEILNNKSKTIEGGTSDQLESFAQVKTEKQALEKECEQLKNQNLQIMSELHGLEIQLQSINHQKKDLEERNASLVQELEKVESVALEERLIEIDKNAEEAQIRQLLDENEMLCDQIQKLTLSLVALQNEKDELQKQRERFKERQLKVIHEEHYLETENAQLQIENKSIIHELEELFNINRSLEFENRMKSDQKASTDLLISQLQEEIQFLKENQTPGVNERFTSLEKEVQENRKLVSELNEENIALSTSLGILRNKENEWKAIEERLQESINELELKCEGREHELKKQHELDIILNEKILQLENELKQLDLVTKEKDHLTVPQSPDDPLGAQIQGLKEENNKERKKL